MVTELMPVVPIAAFTATGDQERLRGALAAGLDAGLTVGEITEILVQMYAYAGFPRSLNALGTFLALTQDRRDRGIADPPGTPPSPIPDGTDMLALGTANQTRLTGTRVAGPVYDFAPIIDTFLKSHLFGDIFARDNLDWQTREVATIAALAALTGTEPQLRSHLAVGLHAGLTPPQMRELIRTLRTEVGSQPADTAAHLLDEVLGTR